MKRATFLGGFIAVVVAAVVAALGLWLIVQLDAEGWPNFALRFAVTLIAIALGVMAGNAYRRARQENRPEYPKEKRHD